MCVGIHGVRTFRKTVTLQDTGVKCDKFEVNAFHIKLFLYGWLLSVCGESVFFKCWLVPQSLWGLLGNGYKLLNADNVCVCAYAYVRMCT